MTKLVAIDFETANRSMASVCAVGISVMEDGIITDAYYSLIRPESNVNYFEPMNVRIHGISPQDVKDAPGFEEVYIELVKYFEDAIVVAHNAKFDMTCLKQTCINTGRKIPVLQYFDTVELSCKVYPFLAHHRLNDMCDYLGIDLNHHHADSDASACLQIVMAVMGEFGEYDIHSLLKQCHTRIYEL